MTSGPLELYGQRSYMLTAIAPVGKGPHKGIGWLCRCDCGKEIVVSAGDFKRRTSCGCTKRKRPQYGENPAHTALYSHYRASAKYRGIEFNLPREFFNQIVQQPCTYCGALPSNTQVHRQHSFLYNGIDRIDSSKGYVLDNCAPCCKICNQAKSTLTPQEWQDWIARIVKFQVSKETS